MARFVLCGSLLALSGCAASSAVDEAKEKKKESSTSETSDTVKVGILHSLSGTMAISEVSLRDAELMAIEEINESGGLLGKKIEPVIEDGASDWPTFAEKAKSCYRKIK